MRSANATAVYLPTFGARLAVEDDSAGVNPETKRLPRTPLAMNIQLGLTFPDL
jgi:hypothetical protein